MGAHSAGSYLAFSRALGRVIAHVHGPIDARTGAELTDRLVDIIDDQGNRQLVVDLSQTTFIDSAGLAVLLDALRRMETNGGDLVLSGPTADVMRVFEVAQLDKVFVITPAWSHPVHGGAPAAAGLPGSGGHAG